MVKFFTVVDIVIASIPIIGFLISTWYLFQSKRTHAFVVLLWGIGLVTAVSGLLLTAFFYNQNFGNTWGGFVVIFLLESGQGVLYFMVAFEFYTSALTMESILLNKPPKLSKQRKNAIFLSATGVYVLL